MNRRYSHFQLQKCVEVALQLQWLSSRWCCGNRTRFFFLGLFVRQPNWCAVHNSRILLRSFFMEFRPMHKFLLWLVALCEQRGSSFSEAIYVVVVSGDIEFFFREREVSNFLASVILIQVVRAWLSWYVGAGNYTCLFTVWSPSIRRISPCIRRIHCPNHDISFTHHTQITCRLSLCVLSLVAPVIRD